MKDLHKTNILLIGSYPPPFGGISVHIMRLYDFLINKGYSCKVLNVGKSSYVDTKNNDIFSIAKLKNLLSIKKSDPLVHIHVSALQNLIKIFVLTLLFNKQKKVITIHSGSFIKKINNLSNIKIQLLKLLLGKFAHIIVVNIKQELALSNNLNQNKDKISVIPAFISPKSSNMELSSKDVSIIGNSNKINLLMSGYWENYYGYDMVIDYLETHNKYLGIFIFYGIPNIQYKNSLINRINKLNNAHYYVDLSPEGFNWILKKTDIYVRNTDRDGDSVAIREAAYWGVKVCASNSVIRPVGTELFSFNNKFEFNNAIQSVINQSNSGKITPGINYANNIYDLYKSSTK